MKKAKPKADPFVSSQRHTLDDLKLFPWTPDRMIAAQSLGVRYPAIGKEGWAAVASRDIYPGAVRDVTLALWLCILTPDEVLAAEAQGEAEAKKRSLAWAEPLGIHDVRKDAFWDAYDQFVQIQRETREAATTPAGSESGTAEDDDEDDDQGKE